MGYLSFDRTLDMSKATVSLWFRIPQATIDGIPLPRVDQYYIPVFVYKIPLIVFGKPRIGTHYEYQFGVFLGLQYGTSGGNVYGVALHPHTVSTDVTSIGILLDYTGLGQKGTARLYVTLQTGDVGEGTNTEWGRTGYQWVGSSDPGGTVSIDTITDFSYMSGQPADVFSIDVGGPQQGPEIAPDLWHHMLVSWDLKDSNRSHGSADGDISAGIASFIDSYSTMSCALDGNDCSGNRLPSNWIGTNDGSGDPNGICTNWTLQYAGKQQGPMPQGPPNVIQGGVSGLPSYHVGFSSGIQADGIFIPAEPEYTRYFNQEEGFGGGSESVRPIYRVDMAELYIWSDLALTSDDASAFISSTGTPTPPESIPFGQPDIKIHGTQAWLKGNNSGHLVGDFSRVGTITPFKPDPQIGVGAAPAPAPALAQR